MEQIGLTQTISQGQRQQQEQRQILSPAALQSLDILQMPYQKLHEKIIQELQTNPFLRQVEPDFRQLEIEAELESLARERNEDYDCDYDESRAYEQIAYDGINGEGISPEMRAASEEFNTERDFEDMDGELIDQAARDQYDDWDYNPGNYYADNNFNPEYMVVDKNENFINNLKLEVEARANISPQDKDLIYILIDNLDSDGLFRRTFSEISQDTGIKKKEFKRALKILQDNFEPAGIGATSETECYRLQLERQGEFDRLWEKFLAIKDLEIKINKRYYGQLMHECKCKFSDILEKIEKFRKLYQYPISHELQEVEIVPDLAFYKEKGKYVAKLLYNDGLFIDFDLKEATNKLKANTKEEKESKADFKKLGDNAEFLIKAVKNRGETLQKVGNFIANYQSDFLDNGKAYLKPLTMAMVANELKLNVSTISRAVENKYALTSQGRLKLKYFFSEGLDNVSVDAIKDKLLEIILNENKKKPYSDQKLTDLINKSLKMNVARRTISKYREKLNIGTCRERKDKQ